MYLIIHCSLSFGHSFAISVFWSFIAANILVIHLLLLYLVAHLQLVYLVTHLQLVYLIIHLLLLYLVIHLQVVYLVIHFQLVYFAHSLLLVYLVIHLQLSIFGHSLQLCIWSLKISSILTLDQENILFNCFGSLHLISFHSLQVVYKNLAIHCS